MNTMQISVVVPSYNEEENVTVFYDTVSPILESLDYQWEIIFVDDGSRDRTVEEVTQIAKQDSRVRLLRLSRNYGSYSALSAGFLYAHGDAIVAISCDLQDPPELITDFVAKWETGADIVWGVRESRNDPGLKSLYANAYYWLVKKFIWNDFPKGGFDFGLFDKRILRIYSEVSPRSTIPFFVMYDMGFAQEQIPYHRRERQFGSSGWGLMKRIKTAVDVFAYFSYVPVRFASIVGVTVSGLAFLYAIFVIVSQIIFGAFQSGWPSIVVVMLFLGGIQLTVLGVLGEYVWRIAEQVRQSPRFLLMDQFGFDSELNRGNPAEHYYKHSHHDKLHNEQNVLG